MCGISDDSALVEACMQYFSLDLNKGNKIHTSALIKMGRVSRTHLMNVDKKNQLDVTFCILYISSNSCSTYFRQPCAYHQELTTA